MSLWTPYKDDPKIPGTVEPPAQLPSISLAPPGSPFHHQPPNHFLFDYTYDQPNYQYNGYDPIPSLPIENKLTRSSLTPDSGCSSGSISPRPLVKISRPFRQMTSRTGTTMSNIREYYKRALQNPPSNPRMRRAVVGKVDEKETDLEYLERRMKNNAAAKRSRELRKLKEDQLAINLAFLESENHRLNEELKVAKEQLQLCTVQGISRGNCNFFPG